MSITFGGRPCEDPRSLLAQYHDASEGARRSWLDPSEWAGKANGFRLTSGYWPGLGHLLLSREAILKRHGNDLTFDDDDGGRRVLYDLVVTGDPRCVTPGGVATTDGTPAYLVEVADRRFAWFAEGPSGAGRPAGDGGSRQYNVRGTGTGYDYLPSTLRGSTGLPWTWAELLWDLAGLLPGDWGGLPPAGLLPFSPDGTPEGYQFYGVNHWRAVCALLHRLGCTFAPDPTTKGKPFSGVLDMAGRVVQVGTPDPALDRALAKHRPLYDADTPFKGTADPHLGSTAVYFPTWRGQYGDDRAASADGGWLTAGGLSFACLGSEDMDVDHPPGGAEGATRHVWDDLHAVLDQFGQVTNLRALGTRARERNRDQLRMAAVTRLHRVYDGVAADPAFLPGPVVSGVYWGDTGDGLRTEILRVAGVRALRVGAGRWEEVAPDDTVLNLRPPDVARHTFPDRPQYDQVIRLLTGLPIGGWMRGAIEGATSSVWVYDPDADPARMNSAGAVAGAPRHAPVRFHEPGRYVKARLHGRRADPLGPGLSLPVYWLLGSVDAVNVLEVQYGDGVNPPLTRERTVFVAGVGGTRSAQSVNVTLSVSAGDPAYDLAGLFLPAGGPGHLGGTTAGGKAYAVLVEQRSAVDQPDGLGNLPPASDVNAYGFYFQVGYDDGVGFAGRLLGTPLLAILTDPVTGRVATVTGVVS